MGLFSWLFGGDKKEQMQHLPASGSQTGSGMHMQHSGSTSGMKMAIDPVCGMEVNPEKAAATSVYQGATYYFCAPGCKRAFDEKPTKYVDESGQVKRPKPMSGG